MNDYIAILGKFSPPSASDQEPDGASGISSRSPTTLVPSLGENRGLQKVHGNAFHTKKPAKSLCTKIKLSLNSIAHELF